jgi:hypothetical protein
MREPSGARNRAQPDVAKDAFDPRDGRNEVEVVERHDGTDSGNE